MVSPAMIRYSAAAAPDILEGGDGNDTIFGGGGFDNIRGGNGDDLIDGQAGGGTYSGEVGNDTVLGGAGDDWFFMGSNYGQDSIDGGSGADSVFFGEFVTAASAVNVDLGAGTAAGGGAGGSGSATLGSIENVLGSQFNDRITGSNAANLLSGDAGNDRIEGGAGNDTLRGEGGADNFVFSVTPGAANADLITDFQTGTDRLILDASAFPALGSAGSFAAADARFWAAAGATQGHDADDRIVYDTATGRLFYDADGSGGGAAQLIVTLEGGAALSPSISPSPAAAASWFKAARGTTLSGGPGDDTGTALPDTTLSMVAPGTRPLFWRHRLRPHPLYRDGGLRPRFCRWWRRPRPAGLRRKCASGDGRPARRNPDWRRPRRHGQRDTGQHRGSRRYSLRRSPDCCRHARNLADRKWRERHYRRRQRK